MKNFFVWRRKKRPGPMVTKYIVPDAYSGSEAHVNKWFKLRTVSWIVGFLATAFLTAFSVGGYYKSTEAKLLEIPKIKAKGHTNETKISEIKRDLHYLTNGMERILNWIDGENSMNRRHSREVD